MIDFAVQEHKTVVLRCKGCGAPVGGNTEAEAVALALENGWKQIDAGKNGKGKSLYCSNHAADGAGRRVAVRDLKPAAAPVAQVRVDEPKKTSAPAHVPTYRIPSVAGQVRRVRPK